MLQNIFVLWRMNVLQRTRCVDERRCCRGWWHQRRLNTACPHPWGHGFKRLLLGSGYGRLAIECRGMCVSPDRCHRYVTDINVVALRPSGKKPNFIPSYNCITFLLWTPVLLDDRTWLESNQGIWVHSASRDGVQGLGGHMWSWVRTFCLYWLLQNVQFPFWSLSEGYSRTASIFLVMSQTPFLGHSTQVFLLVFCPCNVDWWKGRRFARHGNRQAFCFHTHLKD